MPQDKDFKRLVRRRMAVIGEQYTVARAALCPAPVAPGRDVSRWVHELGRVEVARAALAALKALNETHLRPAAVSGLDHADWRVRRTCCQLLDDLPLTPDSIAALQRCLDDDHPLVRRSAVHTLSCKHCKPDGCVFDVQQLYERMASDSSRRVRAAVLGPLGWLYDDEPWAAALAQRFAETDRSAQLREMARNTLAHIERKRRSNQLRLQLPPELRAKTERHAGRWVTIAAGRIVGVNGQGFRHALRTWPDTTSYWVAPGDG